MADADLIIDVTGDIGDDAIRALAALLLAAEDADGEETDV
jgi:hypothetical protein